MGIPDLERAPVLVTGGAGFIGSHLVDALVERGAAVRVLDNLATGHRGNLERHGGDVELVEGDVRDLATCKAACDDRRLVFHQAALGSVPRSVADPVTTLEVNAMGTANVLEAARLAGVRRVVYASSSSVYGDSAALPKVEGAEGVPLSPYAASKVVTEQLAAVFARSYGLVSVGLRYFNVYGPRQDPDGPYAAVIPRFYKACLRAERPVIYGDGRQSRDFTYVADVVRANLLAAGAEHTGHLAVNVAGGRRVTVNELLEVVTESLGLDPDARYEGPRPGDVRHSAADLGRAASTLGYAPEVSLAEGLAEAREHYRRLFAPATS